MEAEREAYDELCCYTLAHGAPEFVHQHVVDAWMAQHADAATKAIGVTFALVGLYLHLERGRTGREVQLAHMALAKRTRDWPPLSLPAERGAMTAADVLAAPAGAERDAAIDAWCASVWEQYRSAEPVIAALLARHGVS